ncbi:MAG: hypothetical protein ACREQ5_03820 [Candidatus Dormibacteria bacterium]
MGAILYPQTAAEIAAGVTPTNYAYATWDVRRLGIVGDGVTDDTAALQRCYTVGGEWKIPPGFQVRCTATIVGKIATRLYADGPVSPNAAGSNIAQVFLIHDFTGTFFDLQGVTTDDKIGAGFSWDRVSFVQKHGTHTGNAGICIRCVVNPGTTVRCPWIRMIDCHIETIATGVDDWQYGIYIDATAVAAPNNMRDSYFSRMRIVAGSFCSGAMYLSGMNNLFLHEIEANLANADCIITGVSGTPGTAFMSHCTWNNVTLDWATTVFGSGNSAATVTSTINTIDVDLGCACLGSPPTLNGTRVTVRGKHNTGKWTVSTNNNTRFEMGANIAEHSGPLASDVALVAGANPAAAGVVRVGNNLALNARNAANNADVEMLRVDGANRVQLAGGGAVILWGTVHVALGGGAAPTFGTIGGSGPGTAAQFAWLKVVDDAGTTGFIPYWR